MTAGTISGPDETRSAHADLLRLFGSNLIVIGFFTPDYAEAASAFRRTSSNTACRTIFMLAPKSRADGGPKYSRSPRCSPSRDGTIRTRSLSSWMSTAVSAATFPKLWRREGCRAARQGSGGRTGLCAEVQLPRHRRHADPGWRRIRRRMELGVPGPRNGNGICFGSDHRTQRRRLFARGPASALRRHGVARCSRRCGHRA